jgi:cell division septal protein FtsQ
MIVFAIEQTLKKHPFVKDAIVSIGANDKLFITVVERKPIALIKEIVSPTADKQVMYFVDADTVVIPYRTETRQIDVPIVYIHNRSTDIPAVITIVQVLQESAQDVLQRIIAVYRDAHGDYVLDADNNCTILVGRVESKESIAQKLPALRAVLNIESNSLGYVMVNDQIIRERIKTHRVVTDIRFDKRVIMTDKK